MEETWPVYFKDRLIISNPNSANAVVTLWTPKETIQKLTDPESYYVMGQLYTKKGINYLIRNLLANPIITNIYIVGNDLMQSGETLIAFFSNGVDVDHKIIGDSAASVDLEIPKEKIDGLRKNIQIHDFRGADKLTQLKNLIVQFSSSEAWASPELFPDPPMPQFSTFPAEVDLLKIRRPTISDAYLSILKHIDMFGLESKPPMNNSSSDSNKMKEILNLSVVITDEDISNPVIPSYMPFSKEDLESYYHGFFDPDKHTEDYTYGERLFNYGETEINKLKEIYPWLKLERFQKYMANGGIDQVEVSIVRKLQGFQYDKGAIALLANTFTDVFPQRPPKKIPCLFLIQCQIYQGKLSLTAYFRSNDMYNAWPLNAFALRKLQTNIADKLEVKVGPMITISNMAHVYEHNYADMKKVLDKEYTGYYCEWDPRGNYVVTTENNEIVVKLISPQGTDELKEWRFDGTKRLASQEFSFILEKELSLSTIGNGINIGRELERAETAIKLGIEYHQDNPLDLSKFTKL